MTEHEVTSANQPARVGERNAPVGEIGKAKGSAMRQGRRQVMIDQQVQGALIGRVLLYWFICQAAMVIAWCAWSVLTAPHGVPAPFDRRTNSAADPRAIGSQLVLPLVLADFLRLSNRFVGPIWNLRNAMKRVELGDPVVPLELRRADFWSDLLGQFNRLLPRLRRQPSAECCPERPTTDRLSQRELAGRSGGSHPEEPAPSDPVIADDVRGPLAAGAAISDGRQCCD